MKGFVRKQGKYEMWFKSESRGKLLHHLCTVHNEEEEFKIISGYVRGYSSLTVRLIRTISVD